MSKFTRPADLKYPQVYHTFKAKDKNSEELVEYRVQDLPEEYFEEAIKLYLTDFIPDEPFSIASDAPSKPETYKAVSDFRRAALKQKFSLGCFKNGSDELVAVNGLGVANRSFKYNANSESVEYNTYIEVFKILFAKFNVCEEYNVDYYLNGFGLCVNREYRGRNVATEVLKARVPFMKALGLKVTASVFTGIGSQTAAVRAGFKEAIAMSYSEVQERFPIYDFSKVKASKFIKIFTLEV